MTVICWFRRVLRLDDHPALVAASTAGPVIPLVILDPQEARDHPASAQRQAMSLPRLQASLHRHHSRLIVRRGDPSKVIADILAETSATQLHSTEGFPFASDRGLRTVVERHGARLILHPAADLVARESITTGQGTTYKVFTPFWKALRAKEIAPPLPAPRLSAPETWPESDGVEWPEARTAMARGWDPVADHIEAGEDAAHERLDRFLDESVAHYHRLRDLPHEAQGTSGLSDSLAIGEISARRIWRKGLDARLREIPGTDDFLREIAWREFARDLFHAMPEMAESCWRPEWNDFPWQEDGPQACAWRQGRTGIAIVDAGMRELFTTGRMHNRVRMIAASYLTKHLLTDWRVGLTWFKQTLTDWDPASNAMNWQWVAGCGPDASPYFRIFNPVTQAEKFDREARYRDHWLKSDSMAAQAFRDAAPRSWKIDLARAASPEHSLASGRSRAMTAYQRFKN
ncbi:deoxyribodipyrimidine photo-lyase [Paracoccus sp. Z330]|uniref:Deoxyribodipyrimidine photo-lyase n=1 Tax=Paracoccus onchidii TaxID=3017813 RepID=A0ABT4ZER2_9RHOB|nr:deoxyribodipyrimidine photo-lyase [Paracoccus onchidii]MDB6177196.1 deoxyribodipyrimidine photo-lyase [Paracoccus onchidii]